MIDLRYMTLLAVQWAVRCFGVDHVINTRERSMRFIEEAIELCQSLGLSQNECTKVMRMVYSRKKGETNQEVGGVMITLMVLCESHDIDLVNSTRDELSRILNKDTKHFAERNKDKVTLLNG